MTGDLGVSAIADYLRETGWQRRPLQWRGASIWTREGADVLVPARDGMGDGDLRVREILDVLAAVEDRAPGEIAQDIGSAPADTQQLTIFPPGRASGFASLRQTLGVLAGLGETFLEATRAVFRRNPAAFGDGTAEDVDGFMAGIQIGAGRPGSYIIPVQVPLDGPEGPRPPLGRLVTRELHSAVSFLSGRKEPLPGPLSPALCDALAGLADESGERPFEIGFGWSRRLPSDMPAATYRFEEDSGPRFRATAEKLRHAESSAVLRQSTASASDIGLARHVITATGLIETLHRDQPDGDQWTIDVRADSPLTGTSRRVLHVQLPDRAVYEAALAAHRQERRVRLAGDVTIHPRRTELRVADATGFDVLD
ncbi:hypothetical protein [Amycolatopsis saalfeldensis]|uniref:Uncharacterized protein n=1 Tax=Amycolatopsis saalfeldensis TaxID=394193 RepID=A0A1H8W1K4_9PSEU|nr:hypothetical protein [Amycolatopsis saalfeldensis]SEP21485.1 hypothetical protein SAMN04489732_104472 [Amycolatopsis saalfeldensis]